jgi:Na+/H+-translocating membrane pyrophosphatase
MAADLFETYVVTTIAAIVLASLIFPASFENAMIYPLVLGAASIITSVIGIFFIRLGNGKNIMGALYKGRQLNCFVDNTNLPEYVLDNEELLKQKGFIF